MPAPCTSCALQIDYTCQDSTSGGARFSLNVGNKTINNVMWGDVTVRYWFTADAGVTQVPECFYAQLMCPMITRKVVAVTPARTKANAYLELSFDASLGTLVGFGNSGEIQLAIHNDMYTPFTQTDDYSFDCTTKDAKISPAPKITAYLKGVLVAGTEPM